MCNIIKAEGDVELGFPHHLRTHWPVTEPSSEPDEGTFEAELLKLMGSWRNVSIGFICIHVALIQSEAPTTEKHNPES